MRKIGWFSDMESQELLILANEIGSSFYSTGEIQTEPSDFHSTISIIMDRFYPLMKMGQMLTSVEVKPGYGTYVVDFCISKTTRHCPLEKIRLLVVQTDTTETYACIISPQQVNFLLNGKGVERRSGALVDHVPQIPTNVTGMLKYGTNLLQAVGQFNSPCIIVLAFMGISSLPEAPVLEDHVLSKVPMTDLENDIIEGSSRISLKCPISFGCIAIPVKGCRCKHLQCFDFNNYADINSRRPFWRCPHCNQPVCYTELRIDQNMAKVLREVGEDVNEIIISVDGSWKPVLEREGKEDEASGIYVKVSVDGAPYLRKIDLELYEGYPEFIKALENMFKLTIGDYSEREGHKGSEYAPTYEDKDGDWMLVGDVPWEMFISSCKRLRIMKRSEARGHGCGV